MPRLALPAAAVALAALAPSPALAADHTIRASNFVFNDATLTIAAGDRVYFANDQGTHNFVFDGGLRYPDMPTAPGGAWNNLSRAFDAAGTYPRYCAAHRDSFGMIGTITVTASPPPGPSPSPQPTPSPSPAPDPGGGGGGARRRPASSPPRCSRCPSRLTFCIRCKRPGVRIRTTTLGARPRDRRACRPSGSGASTSAPWPPGRGRCASGARAAAGGSPPAVTRSR